MSGSGSKSVSNVKSSKPKDVQHMAEQSKAEQSKTTKNVKSTKPMLKSAQADTAGQNSQNSSNTVNTLRRPYALKIEDPDYIMTPEDIRLRIMNDSNVYIKPEDINSVFFRVGFDYKIRHIETYQTAMIHESYMVDRLTDNKTLKLIRDFEPITPDRAAKALPLQIKSYERLEFLGDSVIHYVLAKYLFERYPEMHQGDLTLTRSKIEKKDSLSKYSKELGLHKFVMIGYSIEQVNGRITNPSITEDVFESLVGALLLEAGILKAEEFVIKAIEYLEDIPEIIRTHDNYKDKLMQHYHKIDSKCRHDLRYIDEDFEDKNGKRKYHTRVYDKMTGQFLGEGQGRSKRSAQQNAAKDALLQIGLIGTDENSDEYLEFDFDIDEVLDNQSH